MTSLNNSLGVMFDFADAEILVERMTTRASRATFFTLNLRFNYMETKKTNQIH